MSQWPVDDSQGLFQMRLAQKNDEKLLLAWRNSPEVVTLTQTKKGISSEEHNFWFTTRIETLNQEPIFIFEFLGSPVGMTRLDLVSPSLDSFYISVIVDKSHRGNGYGISMVKQTSRFAKKFLNAKKIYAVVNALNSPSMKLFQRCEFKELKNEKEFKTYEWLAEAKA